MQMTTIYTSKIDIDFINNKMLLNSSFDSKQSQISGQQSAVISSARRLTGWAVFIWRLNATSLLQQACSLRSGQHLGAKQLHEGHGEEECTAD